MTPTLRGEDFALAPSLEKRQENVHPGSNHKKSVFGRFIGNDPRIAEVLELVIQVADTDATVLIVGESGTGKELIAQALHEKSSRRIAPYLAVNCGAIAETLQESELFGHVKGAFTGATAKKVGKFEAAHGGTVFLDEISEMSRPLQAKLLRILQSGEYAPVGMAENRYCNVRVIAAASQNLRTLVDTGCFRQDLYYRLNIIRLELPSLRARKGDIPLLIEHFLHQFCATYHKLGLSMSSEAKDLLIRYNYPGNVRELENLIHRAVIICRGSFISPRDLPSEVLAQPHYDAIVAPANFHEAKNRAVEVFERAYLISVLSECGGIVSRAANRSGLSERNFHEKLKRYGICGKSFRAAAPKAAA